MGTARHSDRPRSRVFVRLLRGGGLDRRKAVYEEQAKGGLYDVKVTKGTYVHVKVTSNPLGCHSPQSN